MKARLALGVGERLARWRHRGPTLVILAYHRVLAEPDPMRPDVPDRDRFASQMAVLAEHCCVLPLSEAAERLDDGSLPPLAVCLTFDDGYADNHQYALPILQRFGLPASFFVATGYLDGGCMFNDCVIEACRAAPVGEWDTRIAPVGRVQISSDEDRRAAAARLIGALKYQRLERRQPRAESLLESVGARQPTDLMMTRAQVRELAAAGMAIGAHTHAHPILARLDAADSAAEIARGRDELVSITGAEIDLFAFPTGQPQRDYLWRDVEILQRLGFTTAVSTAWGVATCKSDRLQLPRLGFPTAAGEVFVQRLARARLGGAGRVLDANPPTGRLA